MMSKLLVLLAVSAALILTVNGDTTAALDGLKSAVEDLGEEVEDLAEEVEELAEEVGEVEDEVGDVGDEIDNVGDEIGRLEEEVESAVDEMNELKTEVSNLQKQMKNGMDDLETKLNGLRIEMNVTIQENVASLRSDMHKDTNRTMTLLQDLQQQLTAISRQSTTETQDIKDTVQTESTRVVSELKNEVHNITTKLDGLSAEMTKLNATIQDISRRSTGDTQDIKDTLQTGFTRVISEVESVCNTSNEDSLQVATQCIPSSCSELGSSPSGYYQIRSPSSGENVTVYCDTTRHCCNSTGGWIRVAYLDMTDPNQQCPSGFTLKTDPKRVCVRSRAYSCISINFPAHGVQYSKVCGQVKGYQKGTPDAFGHRSSSVTIDSNYVDGVSITHGTFPRQHIWTFAAAHHENHPPTSSHFRYICPCTITDTPYTGRVPSFIGNDYFCETGAQELANVGTFYHEDLLWDGEGCGPTSSCCQFNSPPWFCKELPQPTTDDIEVRVCTNEYYGNEDVAIELIELYLQ